MPDDLARDFRAALVDEIAADAKYARKGREAVEEAVRDRAAYLEVRIADLQSATRSLYADLALATQADLSGDGEFELRGDPGDLAHMCERLIRVLRPKLGQALDIGPMDAQQAVRAHELIDRLRWAVDKAAELHAKWSDGAEI